jgi:hypothetical protein
MKPIAALIVGVVGACAVQVIAQGERQAQPKAIPAIVNGRMVGGEVAADWPIEARTRTLTYTNPYNQNLAPRWCDGEIVYRVSFGEVKVDPKTVKAAKEYLTVYAAPPASDPTKVDRVPDQLPIYDTKPGDEGYNPIWHYHYVIVPKDYKANTLRSEDDVKKSGYPIVPVDHYTN